MRYDPSQAPMPGVYRGVDATTYHAWPLISSSLIRAGETPADIYHAAQTERTSPQMQFGQMLHVSMLEPHRFGLLYVTDEAIASDLSDQFSRPRNSGPYQEWKAAMLARGVEIVTTEMMDAIEGSRRAIMAHPTASVLFGDGGETEISIVWDDADTGLRCKCRIDRVAGDLLVDLKSSRIGAIAEHQWTRTVESYGYDMQAAMYVDGYAAAFGRTLPFAFVCVESEPPHKVEVYQVATWMDAARTSYKHRLQVVADCIESGEWPGYPVDQSGIKEVEMPKWRDPNRYMPPYRGGRDEAADYPAELAH